MKVLFVFCIILLMQFLTFSSRASLHFSVLLLCSSPHFSSSVCSFGHEIFTTLFFCVEQVEVRPVVNREALLTCDYFIYLLCKIVLKVQHKEIF